MATGLALSLASHADASTPRHQVDAQEMQNEVVLRPAVAKLIEEGETALAAGRYDDAVRLFEKAVAGSPHSALPRRRLCIALLSLGRRSEAIASCQAAAANLGSGMDFRALVGALVAAPPTPGELSAALAYAHRATKIMDHEPWGYAAQCDIMRRLGDLEMLSQCLNDLQRVAPDHYETRRIEAVVAALRSPVRWAVGAGALALVTLLTALHAAYRRATPRALGAALLLLALLCAPRPARADAPERTPVVGSLSQFAVDDADPTRSVPSAAQRDANPLEYGYFLMDLADRAAKASERGDHAAAARYWMAMYKAVPDRSVSLAKACESYEAAEDWNNAVGACKLALEKGGLLVRDFARFVTVAVRKPGKLTPQELSDIDQVLKHLEKTGADHAVIDELSCNVAVKQGDAARLEQCSSALAARVPDHPQTIYYQWALAVLRDDRDAARSYLTRARFVGSGSKRLEEMASVTAQTGSPWRRGRPWVVTLALLLLAAAAFVVTRALRPREAPQTARG